MTVTGDGIVRKGHGTGHSYYIDGVKAAGVTTVIGEVLNKNLTYWAARSVAEFIADLSNTGLDAYRHQGRDRMIETLARIPTDIRNAKAARGKKVHKILETMITGAEVDVPEDLIDYVIGAQKFMDQWQPRLVLSETTVASRRFRYAGTFDLLADVKTGERVLFDYKTSKAVYRETAMQMAAYRWAEWYVGTDGTEMPMEELGIDCCKVVHIYEGGYSVIPVDTTPEVFAAFRHLRAIYDIGPDRMKAWVGQPEDISGKRDGQLVEANR